MFDLATAFLDTKLDMIMLTSLQSVKIQKASIVDLNIR